MLRADPPEVYKGRSGAVARIVCSVREEAERAELFPEGKRPARTIYQAAALPFGGKVKVTGVALKD